MRIALLRLKLQLYLPGHQNEGAGASAPPKVARDGHIKKVGQVWGVRIVMQVFVTVYFYS